MGRTGPWGPPRLRTGISSYSAKRNTLEGEKHFTQAPAEANKKDADIEFLEGEVYNVDIIVSSGSGKPKQQEVRTTVYRRTEATYQLKLKASRTVFSEVQSKFGVFAFTLRSAWRRRRREGGRKRRGPSADLGPRAQ